MRTLMIAILASISCSYGQELPVNPDKVLQQVSETGKPATAACIDPATRAQGEDKCELAFKDRCDKIQKNSKAIDVNTAGKKNIREALDAALSQSGSANLNEIYVEELKQVGLTDLEVKFTDQKKADDDYVEGMFGFFGSSNIQRNVVNKEMAKCTSPIPKTTNIDEMTKYMSENSEGVKNVFLNMKVPTDQLYTAVQRQCMNVAFAKDPPVGCSQENMQKLREDIIVKFSADDKVALDSMNAKLKALYTETTVTQAKTLARVETADLPPAGAPVPDDKKAMFFQYAQALRSSMCSAVTPAVKEVYDSALVKMRTKLVTSEPFVRTMEKNYFNAKNLSAANAIIEEIKKFENDLIMTKVAPRVPLTAEQKAALGNQVTALKIEEYKTLPADRFSKKDGFALPTLNLPDPKSKQALNMNDPFMNSLDKYSDETLGGFKSFNAAYVPKRVSGSIVEPEHIELNPALLPLCGSDPNRVVQALSHEVGHKFGPVVSEMNGINLRPAYEKLNACLSKQLNLSAMQLDEAYADWISAEFVANKLSTIKDESEKQVFLDSCLADFCVLDKYSTLSLNEAFIDPHPATFARINLIYGHQPGIRKELGCPSTPHCTLDGEVK